MDAPIGGLQRTFRHEEESGLVDGFVLNGQSNLQTLARFYGLKAPVSDSCMSLADYLVRACGGKPRVGDRTVWDGRAELIVREMEEGTIRKVCLRILQPPWRDNRRPRPGERAHGRVRGPQDRHVVEYHDSPR